MGGMPRFVVTPDEKCVPRLQLNRAEARCPEITAAPIPLIIILHRFLQKNLHKQRDIIEFEAQITNLFQARIQRSMQPIILLMPAGQLLEDTNKGPAPQFRPLLDFPGLVFSSSAFESHAFHMLFTKQTVSLWKV